MPFGAARLFSSGCRAVCAGGFCISLCSPTLHSLAQCEQPAQPDRWGRNSSKPTMVGWVVYSQMGIENWGLKGISVTRMTVELSIAIMLSYLCLLSVVQWNRKEDVFLCWVLPQTQHDTAWCNGIFSHWVGINSLINIFCTCFCTLLKASNVKDILVYST